MAELRMVSMNRLRTALTLLVFMVSLALAPLVQAARGRSVRPRPSRWTNADGTFNRSAWARDRARNADGTFAPGYRSGVGSSSPGTALVPYRGGGDVVASTSAGGRFAASNGGGGGTSTALARRGADGPSTALARRDGGGLPARVDAPTTGGRAGAGADGPLTNNAFRRDMERAGMEPISSGANGTVSYRNPRDGSEFHFIQGEGRMAIRKPDGSYHMATVLNRDAIQNAYRQGNAVPRPQMDVQPIGATTRARAGADGPSTGMVVRNGDATPTVRPSADAPAATAATAATRKGRFRGLGRGLLLGTAAFSGGYALRNTIGNPADNSSGAIDGSGGFGQSSGPGGVAGTGGSTTGGSTTSGVTATGGDTTLGSGALYNGGSNGGGTTGAPGVTTGGSTGPNGIVTGDPRRRTTGDQDQDGFAVGSLNRPPTQRLDFNFER
jgi:hypothetical protein